jgi:hypothetical protein
MCPPYRGFYPSFKILTEQQCIPIAFSGFIEQSAAFAIKEVLVMIRIIEDKPEKCIFNAASLSRKSPSPGGRGETVICNQPDFSPSPCPSLREGSLKETALSIYL